MGEKVKGLRCTLRQLQNSHGAVKYSIENIVNNIITMYCFCWVLDFSGDRLVSYIKSPITPLYT